jgi:bacteriocin biosynthesis cyclodehydratase domain-containing protein
MVQETIVTVRTQRPRLALPYTVLSAEGSVSLCVGEDHRYTFKAPNIERWLPDLLAGMNGRATAADLLKDLPKQVRDDAGELIARLYSERILVDGIAIDAHEPQVCHPAPEGSGALCESLVTPNVSGRPIVILCQDRLDYDEVLRFNRRCLAGNSPFLWATYGPASRGYVSPLMLPDAGPCLDCLLDHFKRLSPAPEFYELLIVQGQAKRPIQASEFPPQGIEMLRQLVLWKISAAALSQPPAALYRLHVLEIETMEVTTHRVFTNPDCSACKTKNDQ